MLIAAAIVPGTPLLVPEVAVGAAAEMAELRAAAVAAVAKVIECEPDALVVLSSGSTTQLLPAGLAVSFAGLGLEGPAASRSLPLAAGVGQWCVEQVDGTRELQHWTVADSASAEEGRTLSAAITGTAQRVGLVVVANGSASRTDKAPGSFDERAAGFDADLLKALENADAAALSRIDARVATALKVEGLGALKALAAAATESDLNAHGILTDDRYGVFYVTGTWLLA